ncbi:DNA replication licensing factor mcm10 [Gaeumannomyces tritici R3-111a-1]|uniref:DNA replication licensing factor mcm10 n=1 Tax=Gaeumannomyces tritici (strain R3-111a-1) TaxID=644352 RepID=J3NH69_GAET3|nr:DNA replication licensing factor mcm10 [Gaeumannomyces tritici R3-111a-1]EJT80612.1 DNA replication licensing factor mcm10 [Gaeumannomyces tritici R3-111a-1]
MPLPEAEPQWPPRSPHEALMGTPGGRERLRRLAERTSPSPSPSKMRPSRTAPNLSSGAFCDDYDDDDADDDEEMLQLKLQEIQAKLKLKKLQKAGGSRTAQGAQGSSGSRAMPQFSAARAERAEKLAETGRQQASVEVPASPVRRAPQQEQRSPLKVTLGIDKGLRAHDVSLKRAGSNARQSQGQTQQQQQRSRVTGTSSFDDGQPQRPLSFNERLAMARTDEVKRLEKQQRVQNLRSAAFTVGKDEMESYKTTAAELPDLPDLPQTYSRAEIVGVENRPLKGPSSGGGYLKRSNTAPSIKAGGRSGGVGSDGDKDADNSDATKSNPKDKDDASFESYSGFHLKKRILPHEVLTRSITGKKVYLMKDFLRHVKAPDWSLPDDECDIVLFAVLASKSDPKSHKPMVDSDGKEKASDRGKYMVMTLVDFTFELELFLFNTGFDRFWKLTPGTVLAILNPTIMPPPKGREATNKFSIVINSDCDTILEVGSARDLGYCQSVRRDGTKCPTWVNSKRTEYCEFHSNEAVSKARSARVELSGPGFGKLMAQLMKASDDPSKPWKHNSRQGSYRTEKDKRAYNDYKAKQAEHGHYDQESQSRVFVSRSAGSAALLDREGEFLDKLGRNEALKRRIAQREREKDIVAKLGADGVGAGRDYMQKRAKPPSSTATAASSSAASSFSSYLHADGSAGGGMGAAALDLLARAKNTPAIDLGPAKRKRPDSVTSNSTSGGTVNSRSGVSSLGWGTALRDRLGKMKEGASTSFPPPNLAAGTSAAGATTSSGSRGDRSPVRKKTRFVTDKGIREAGRESLGAELAASTGATTEKAPAATAVAAAAAAAVATRNKLLRRVVVEDDVDDDELLIV